MKKTEVRGMLMIGDKIEIYTREVEQSPIATWNEELEDWKKKVKKEKEKKK